MNHIAFPGLGLGPFMINESFNLFGLTIHFYGLIIAVGILLAFLFCSRLMKKEGLSQDVPLDLILYGLPSAIVCARLYYVIFEWASYKDTPLDVFKIWEGGLAIYGAIIGACLSTYIYCKVKKISLATVFDIGAFGLLIGQICGRWGNFVNAEAYGGITELPWRMHLIDVGILVHPTFLYESLWNIGVFIVLLLRRKHLKFPGENFISYLALYGLGRCMIEGLRDDSLYLGPFRISQIVALLCFVIGTAIIIYKRYKIKKEEQ